MNCPDDLFTVSCTDNGSGQSRSRRWLRGCVNLADANSICQKATDVLVCLVVVVKRELAEDIRDVGDAEYRLGADFQNIR